MTGLNSKAYTVAAWAGIVLVGVAMAVVAARGDWSGTLLLAVFLAASVAFVVAEPPLPSLFNLLFVAAAMLNAAGWIWNLYREVVGYDEIAHSFTSFAVTLSLGFLIYRRVREPFREHRLHFVLVIASFGITLGVFWEVFEWFSLHSLANPVVDLIMDGLGAIAAGVVAAWALGLEEPESERSGSQGVVEGE